MSAKVCDLWDLVPVEVRGNNVSVSSKISVNDPLSFLHIWEIFVFCQPINSVAGLAENERVLLLSDPLGILLSWKEWLSLEELEVLKDLAAESVINAIIDKVVSAVS